jgi:hypothetical protein
MTNVNLTHAEVSDSFIFGSGNTMTGVPFEFAGEVTYKQKHKEAEDYLVDPFMDLINSPEYLTDFNHMKVLTGVTGQGKTFFTCTKFIPTLWEKFDLQLVIITAPQTVILDYELLQDTAIDCRAIFCRNAFEALTHLRRGKKVIFASTNQGSFVTASGSILFDWIKSNKIRFAIFVDEAHMWTISHGDNMSKVSGRGGSGEYKAALYNDVSKLSEISPHIFGITATPNHEHTGVVKPIGNMRFSLINELPPLSAMIYRSAWLDSTTFFDRRGNDEDVVASFWNFLDVMHEKMQKTGNKRTMIINCARNNSATYTTEDVLALLADYYETTFPDEADVESIIEMNADGCFLRSPDGSFNKKILGGDEEAKALLNDKNHPAKFALIIEKGKAGMNIFNLKHLFSFRDTKPKTDDGELVIDMMLQTIGRLVRLNTGVENSEFTKKYGYDLRKYVDQASEEELENLLVDNSFDICVPYTGNWVKATNVFRSKYSSEVAVARKWIENRKLTEKFRA